MKVASRKAKGRKFQQWVRDKLLAGFSPLIKGLNTETVRSAIMGESGADITILSPELQLAFPFRIEVKAQERFKYLYDCYEQCLNHKGDGESIVFIRMNRRKPLVIIDAEYFIQQYVNRYTNGTRKTV